MRLFILQAMICDMILKSLGYKSDLIFTSFDGEVLDRGHYMVVRTHSNPNYFWGNLLLFPAAPKKGDLARWSELFKTEFIDPRIYHMTFGWDDVTGAMGEVDPFIRAGFKVEKNVVLSAKKQDLVFPKHHNKSVVISSLQKLEDWETCIQVQVACARDNFPKEQWERFHRMQMSRYQKMSTAGLGRWFCAYSGDRVAACLGIYTEGRLGRFQMVSSHPEFQRQGICATLVYESAKHAFEAMGVDTLVMIADEEYHAARIYESVGFRPTERLAGVCRWVIGE